MSFFCDDWLYKHIVNIILADITEWCLKEMLPNFNLTLYWADILSAVMEDLGGITDVCARKAQFCLCPFFIKAVLVKST